MVRSIKRAAVLLSLALALAGCGDGPEAAPSPTRQPVEVATSKPTQRTSAQTAPVETSPAQTAPAETSPAQLDIPAIGLSTSLIELGLNEDRTVEVPEDPARAGWFNLGTVPGQHGSAVILGHVDSLTGPAVFADLATLSVGDEIGVGLSDATVVTFRVKRVATFANADFPAQRVYAGTPGRASLNLVTCGGDYDRDRGGYQSNVVVFTERVSS